MVRIFSNLKPLAYIYWGLTGSYCGNYASPAGFNSDFRFEAASEWFTNLDKGRCTSLSPLLHTYATSLKNLPFFLRWCTTPTCSLGVK